MKTYRVLNFATLVLAALTVTACGEQKSEKKAEEKPAAAASDAKATATPAAADDKQSSAAAAASPADKKSEAPAAPIADEKKAAAAPATPAAPTPATPAAQATGDNAEVQDAAKAAGLVFKDGRYRDGDNHPTPVVTKDYKVDWAVWQGFRRYHDACHVCHGPNAGGSTFAPALAESLKTIDYETFYGIVVGGKRENKGGTEFVMPAFGEDKNIMCYLDDIYSYIKARSINLASEGKAGMPPGRPAGREDISPEARKANAECFGEDQSGGGKK